MWGAGSKALGIQTGNEERIPGEDGAVLAVLHVIADRVLRVAGRVQHRHDDVLADAERFSVRRRSCLVRALGAANDGQVIVVLQDFLVATSAAPVTASN